VGILDRLFAVRPARMISRRQSEAMATAQPRVCRFEIMEERRMLNADPLVVGAVYAEEDIGSDSTPDTFEITFAGGAPGTQLTRIVIDGDQVGNFGNVPGLSAGDIIFDPVKDPNTLGSDKAHPFKLIHVKTRDGLIKENATVEATVKNSQLELHLELTNVEVGDVLVFTIDVDEVLWFDPNETDMDRINEGLDPITSGAEFHGTFFRAYFSAPHFQDAEVVSSFVNRYDPSFEQANALLPPDQTLQLPGDDERLNRVRTAGAVGDTMQTPLPVTISGTVFHDRNQDLHRDVDADEHGIPNVKLTLWQQDAQGQYQVVRRDGATVTTVTDSQGDYQFGTEWNLLPGTFQVRQTQPTDYQISVGAIPGSVAGTPTGASTNTNTLSNIQIPLGDTHAVNYDFAEANPAMISGYVYHDRNNDGQRSSSSEEEGVTGVKIQLYDQNDLLVAETTTNGQGYYQFRGLGAGIYRIQQLQPSGWIDGKDSAGTLLTSSGTVSAGVVTQSDLISEIILMSGYEGRNYNFGERLGSLAGTVHADTNGNCVFDPQEQGLAGVTIRLIDENGAERTTTTDDHGRYEFLDLPPGTYSVIQEQPHGYFNGSQKAGTAGGDASQANMISQVTIGTSHVHLEEYNFCEKPGSLSGYVYHDRNDDGIRQPGQGEEAIPNVTLRLLNEQGQVVQGYDGQPLIATTNSDGFYEFTGLAPGVYTIEQLHPEGWIDGRDTAGWIEYGTPQQRVVGEADGNDRIRAIQLVQEASELGALHGVHYNFGERLGSIAGLVYYDANGNCITDPGEEGIADVTMVLVNATGQQWTTTTDEFGRYRFDDLPVGTYQVIQEQPSAYFNGGQVVGTGGGNASGINAITDIVINGNQIRLEQYNFCEALGSLGGYVYHDRNNNGLREPGQGEEPISGVILRLRNEQGELVRDAAGQPRTAVTNSEGFYEFRHVGPGVYTIEQMQPDVWIDGLDTPGLIGEGTPHERSSGQADGNDRLVNIELLQQPTQRGSLHGTHYNFGELRETSLSGRVFADINGNCVFEPDLEFSQPQQGEHGISGVTLTLRDAFGNVVASMQTDSEGRYKFDGLTPGSYTIEQSQPAGYFSQGQKAGNLGGDASQSNRIQGIELQSGDIGLHYDFCEAPPATLTGYVFQDGAPVFSLTGRVPVDLHESRDGQFTPDDTPLAGVVLELRSGIDGRPIMGSALLSGIYGDGPVRAVTDENGYYEFAGLPAGNYAVYQVQPEGFEDHIDTPGTTGGAAWNRHEPAPADILEQLASSPPPQFDAILGIPLQYGQISAQNNFSEVVLITVPNVGPGPLPPVPLNPPDPAYVPLAPLTFPIYVAPPERVDIPIYGAGGDIDFTWHLSVIDGGRPRGQTEQSVSASSESEWVHATMVARNWRMDGLRHGRWTMDISSDDEQRAFEYLFGLPGAIPLTGDFSGSGVSQLAIYYRGEWFIDLNGNGEWDEGDLWCKLGDENDLPVVGDWNGDGKDDIGIFGIMWAGDPKALEREPGLPDAKNPGRDTPKNIPPSPEEATDRLRALRLTEEGEARVDLIDHVFRFGSGGDIPVAGDWNGDGIDTVGIFRGGAWVLDVNGDGRLTAADEQFTFGNEGDIPLVGDFNGDGIDDIGVYRQGTVIIDSNRNREFDATDRVFELAGEGDHPIVGDFNGDGVDEVGLYQELGQDSGESGPRMSRLPGKPST
jgi:serine-aspartate repeat-containing protein C/D/E